MRKEKTKTTYILKIDGSKTKYESVLLLIYQLVKIFSMNMIFTKMEITKKEEIIMIY